MTNLNLSATTAKEDYEYINMEGTNGLYELWSEAKGKLVAKQTLSVTKTTTAKQDYAILKTNAKNYLIKSTGGMKIFVTETVIEEKMRKRLNNTKEKIKEKYNYNFKDSEIAENFYQYFAKFIETLEKRNTKTNLLGGYND